MSATELILKDNLDLKEQRRNLNAKIQLLESENKNLIHHLRIEKHIKADCLDGARHRIVNAENKVKKLLDALKENLEFDEKIFKSSDGMGASLSCILRARGVIKEVEEMK